MLNQGLGEQAHNNCNCWPSCYWDLFVIWGRSKNAEGDKKPPLIVQVTFSKHSGILSALIEVVRHCGRQLYFSHTFAFPVCFSTKDLCNTLLSNNHLAYGKPATKVCLSLAVVVRGLRGRFSLSYMI